MMLAADATDHLHQDARHAVEVPEVPTEEVGAALHQDAPHVAWAARQTT